MLRLLILIGIIAVLVSPEARAKIAPHTHWLLDPAYEWSVQTRLGQIAHSIDGEAAAGRPYPTTTEGLAVFLQSFYGGTSKSLDPWGNDLFMTRDGRGLRVASAGRDGRRGSPDDLLSQPVILP
jgi:hypothetical protein